MSDSLKVVTGLVLIGLCSFVMLSSLPSLMNATDSTNTRYENYSAQTKQGINFTNSIVSFLPGIFFLVGIGLVVSGARS